MSWTRRPLGLQAWLVTAFVAMGVIASLAVLLMVLPTLENSIRSDQANREGKRVSDSLSVPTDLDFQAARTLINRLAVELGGEVRLISPSGNIIPANVSPQIAYLPEFRPTPPGQLALTTRSGSRATVSESGGSVIWAAAPLRIEGDGWALEAGVPVRGAAGEIAIVRRRVLFAVVTVIALASIVGLLLAHLLGRRMRGLAGTAAALAAGDLSARAGAVAPRELTSLGDSINTMASRLEALVAETVTDRDRARALVSSLAEGVIAVGPDGEVAIANEAAQQLLGMPAGASVRLEELPPAVREPIAEVLADERLRPLSTEVMLPGGAEVALHVSPLDRGAGVVLTLRDVTDERRLARARRDLIANVSHELKTPLTAIKGFLELLEDDQISPARRREFLDVMSTEVLRLERLVAEQLELARLDAGALRLERQDVDLGELADEVVASRTLLAEREGIHLASSPRPPDPITVAADPARVEQILLILLDNALRHTPDGGKVTVAVGTSGDEGLLTVRDTGEGIPLDAQPFVFDRFYRVDPAREGQGAGLGLAIARGLAEAHGGSAEVRSAPGVGSVFTVRFPLADGLPPERAGRPEPEREPVTPDPAAA